jgi:hypothetical protein
MEFRCGMIWKIGSLLTKIKPTFLSKYKANTGISIKDIAGAEINEVFKGKKIIQFSPTIPEDEQNELTEIFYEITRKYSGIYQDIFQDLGWKLVSSDFFIIGEIEIQEIKYQ